MIKRMKYILLLVIQLGAVSVFAQHFETYREKYDQPFATSADSVIKLGQMVSTEVIKSSFAQSIRAVDFKGAKPSKKVLSGAAVFAKAKAATVFVGSAYKCPHCEHTHVNSSTGYAISENGIVVTNHHVVKMHLDMVATGNTPLGLLVRFADGKTYAVKEVLSASEQADLAVLQLDLNGAKVPALALAAPAHIGDDAYALGHSKGMYYFFSKGIVNAKYQDKFMDEQKNIQGIDIMAISADYAAGASGGPILNANGDVIGTVSSTRTVTYSKENPSVQMVLKLTIPVESLTNVIQGRR